MSADHYRIYNNPKWEEFNTNINPAIDAYDEEKSEKVRKKSPRYKYFERNETKSSERETREFLEESTEEELENSKPKNITEELIDQALYEAQYIKKDTENDEYKSNLHLIIQNLIKEILLLSMKCLKLLVLNHLRTGWTLLLEKCFLI